MHCTSISPKVDNLSDFIWLRFLVEKFFASKSLVNHIFRLGYSISYDEILRFKHSVITSSTVRNTPVKRIKERAKASSIVKNKEIPIVDYTSRSDYGLLKLKLDSMNKLSTHHYKYVQSYNLLWQCSWFFRASNSNWSGYMQDLMKTFSE